MTVSSMAKVARRAHSPSAPDRRGCPDPRGHLHVVLGLGELGIMYIVHVDGSRDGG